MKDLWANKYEKMTGKAPMTILKEQASLLSEENNHLVTGRVWRAKQAVGNNNSLRYEFVFTTPARRYYHSPYFAIEYEFDFYPVFFYLDEETQKEVESQLGKASPLLGRLSAQSEPQFLSVIEKIFRAEETLRIMDKIRAYSKLKGG